MDTDNIGPGNDQQKVQPGSSQQQALMAQLPHWRISIPEENNQQDHRIQRTFYFQHYADALQFTADLGALASQASHYPSIITAFKKVSVFWHTKNQQTGEDSTENPWSLQKQDFTLAAQTDELINRT